MTARGGLVRSDSADRLRADATRDVQLTGSWLSLITSSLPLSSFKTSLLATAKEQVSQPVNEYEQRERDQTSTVLKQKGVKSEGLLAAMHEVFDRDPSLRGQVQQILPAEAWTHLKTGMAVNARSVPYDKDSRKFSDFGSSYVKDLATKDSPGFSSQSPSSAALSFSPGRNGTIRSKSTSHSGFGLPNENAEYLTSPSKRVKRDYDDSLHPTTSGLRRETSSSRSSVGRWSYNEQVGMNPSREPRMDQDANASTDLSSIAAQHFAHGSPDPVPSISQQLTACEHDTRLAQHIPLDLDCFRQHIMAALNELRHEQELSNTILLGRARAHNEVAQRKLFKGIKNMHSKSPFAVMTSVEGVNLKAAKTSSVGKLGHLLHNAVAKYDKDSYFNVHTFETRTTLIPPYTHYISTRKNLLVEGDKQRLFLPYHGDDFKNNDEDYEDLEGKICNNQERFHYLNKTEEEASPWLPDFDRLLEGLGTDVCSILEFLFDEDRLRPSELPMSLSVAWDIRIDHLDEGYFQPEDDVEATGKKKQKAKAVAKIPERRWQTALRVISGRSSTESLAAASVACMAFKNVAGFSMWHVIRVTEFAAQAASGRLKPRDDLASSLSSSSKKTADVYTELACTICKTHDCYGHGKFDDDATTGENNIRIRVTSSVPQDDRRSQRSTGTRSSDPKTLLGLNEDGTVSGDPWGKLTEESGVLKDEELCSKDCFWDKCSRIDRTSYWNANDNQTLQTFRSGYQYDRRGPCMLARMGIMDQSCADIFLKLVNLRPPVSSPPIMPKPGTKLPRRKYDTWLSGGKVWNHGIRRPFVPCNHAGPCDSNACSCFQSKISCEKTCQCSLECDRRFRGCRCHSKKKLCWQSEQCDCFRLNRECDPDLCQSCGSHDVLDPVNRYNDEAIKGKCRNAFIQRGVPRRTILGPSELLQRAKFSGWGLYMGEETKAQEYIGEYVGEICEREEAEQRGIIYDKRNMSYLFDLNHEQTLDSTPMGNKLRYINHQSDNMANCYAKVMFCGTVQRIGMFASKDIAVGEEMLFDYGTAFADRFDLVKITDDGKVIVERARKIDDQKGAKVRQTASKSGLDSRTGRAASTRKRRHSEADVGAEPDSAVGVASPEDGCESVCDGLSEVSGSELDNISALDSLDDTIEDSDEIEDDEGDEVKKEDDDPEPRVIPKKGKSSTKSKSKAKWKSDVPKATTASDRMRKAWITRYAREGRVEDSKAQRARFEAKLNTDGR